MTRRRIPDWLWLSLVTIVVWGLWGIQSKVISSRVSVWMNQVLFVIGLVPLALWALFSGREPRPAEPRGISWAILTGLLGGLGNIAFILALMQGGQASVVVPLTCLFPVVTVLLAVTTLRENVQPAQWAGLALAIVAIVVLGG